MTYDPRHATLDLQLSTNSCKSKLATLDLRPSTSNPRPSTLGGASFLLYKQTTIYRFATIYRCIVFVMPITAKKFVRNVPVKAKCPFPSARTLSPTFAGLYSRFQFAFEKLPRIFLCKLQTNIPSARDF